MQRADVVSTDYVMILLSPSTEFSYTRWQQMVLVTLNWMQLYKTVTGGISENFSDTISELLEETEEGWKATSY
jgi:hypothetical protein